uniref:Uncharacterized protein n=1 Tax=Chromera velia CCMP2878 TaxID=1169474 RepID=A0A0G4IB00_9ALVE|eukprot:Cvel_2154.t1-p1 / transcript=Cvel_2154.t1 / gene=Cvel_2154 / organism=Chromera_velia_CCMP2878 / gene_product=hypothetical protein / transcript_product=hypothetical protein / location=Cvel_scaffold83:126393-127274(+) / protein_length=294 / sequence_SO=supercontig / SO=protein_coding / is_pseudo=false
MGCSASAKKGDKVADLPRKGDGQPDAPTVDQSARLVDRSRSLRQALQTKGKAFAAGKSHRSFRKAGMWVEYFDEAGVAFYHHEEDDRVVRQIPEEFSTEPIVMITQQGLTDVNAAAKAATAAPAGERKMCRSSTRFLDGDALTVDLTSAENRQREREVRPRMGAPGVPFKRFAALQDLSMQADVRVWDRPVDNQGIKAALSDYGIRYIQMNTDYEDVRHEADNHRQALDDSEPSSPSKRAYLISLGSGPTRVLSAPKVEEVIDVLEELFGESKTPNGEDPDNPNTAADPEPPAD